MVGSISVFAFLLARITFCGNAVPLSQAWFNPYLCLFFNSANYEIFSKRWFPHHSPLTKLDAHSINPQKSLRFCVSARDFFPSCDD
jgi:hypothetical protein